MRSGKSNLTRSVQMQLCDRLIFKEVCIAWFLCRRVHYWMVEGLVSIEWLPYSRDVSCGGIHYGE